MKKLFFIACSSFCFSLLHAQVPGDIENIRFEYTEEDGCGSLDFMFRGLKFHVWEYHDEVWGAETNIYEAGRSQDIEGDYEEIISGEILSWPDMLPGM